MYGMMTEMAEGEGGAGRAWTKGVAAQKGHARPAQPAAFHCEPLTEPHHPIAFPETRNPSLGYWFRMDRVGLFDFTIINKTSLQNSSFLHVRGE